MTMGMWGIGGYTGLGAAAGGTTTISVRALQKLLLQKDVSVGPTGADGVWGPYTAGAYSNACAEAGGGDCQATPASSKREVTLSSSALAAIRALPDDPRPDPAERRAPSAAIPSPATDLFVGASEKKSAWPWVLGVGGGLLLVGGAYWYYQHQPGRKPA